MRAVDTAMARLQMLASVNDQAAAGAKTLAQLHTQVTAGDDQETYLPHINVADTLRPDDDFAQGFWTQATNVSKELLLPSSAMDKIDDHMQPSDLTGLHNMLSQDYSTEWLQ
jgi:hypothetical protein